MKNMQQVFLSFFIMSWLCAGFAQAQPRLEKLWTTDGLNVPESVYYYHDDKSTYLFVSQIDGDPGIADGKGGIAKMTLTGELFSPDWITGLNAPKGMAVYDGKLYVADLTEVVVINIKKAEVEKKIPVASSVFLNDITIDGQGVIYVSDTKAQKIYRIKDSVADIYLDKVDNVNGLKLLGGNLVVGAGNQLLLVDRDKNRLQIAKGFAQAIDGVEPINRSDFLVSCTAGLIYYVRVDGHLDLLLDTQSKANAADIGFDPGTLIVYVPNLFKNSVTAYQLILK